MKRLFSFLYIGLMMSVAGVASAGAQKTVTLPHSFTDDAYGAEPNSLIQAQDGNFYGTTAFGGSPLNCTNDLGNLDGCGTIFQLTPLGSGSFTLTTLYQFSGGPDGGVPAGIIQGPDGNLYGTTAIGGKSINNGNCVDLINTGNDTGCGTIFEISPSNPPAAGQLQPIYSFVGDSRLNYGAYPNPLIMGAGGVFYGAALVCSGDDTIDDPTSGGTTECTNGGPFVYGVLFSFTPDGANPVTPTPLSTFGGSNGDNKSNLVYPNSLIEVAVPLNAQPSAQTDMLYGSAQIGGGPPSGGSVDPCLENTETGNSFGCGGVFSVNLSTNAESDLCVFDENGNVGSGGDSIASIREPLKTDSDPRSQIVVVQSSGRFPANGNPWNFDSDPVSIAIGSDGNIYGTTPPVCFSEGTDANYGLSCTPSDAPATVYQCIPPTTPTGNATLNTIYQFNGTSKTSGGNPDGGGSLQGLILASDGNFYGTSGDVAFDLTPAQMAAFTSSASTLPLTTLPQSGSLLPSGYSPNSMIQGSDGTFYGTTGVGGATNNACTGGCGAIFEVSASLNPPVQLCWQTPCSGSATNSSSQIGFGSSANLTWMAPNAYSLTSQQCYPYVESKNAPSAGNWGGQATPQPLKGSVSGGVFGNTVTITPTATGKYIYALTCGGTVTASATLVVLPAPPVMVTPLATGITTTQSLGVTVTVSGTPTPTGTVIVSGGSYTSLPMALISGSATVNIPAETLPPASYTLMATYTPDSASSSTYGSSTGTAATSVTVSLTTPVITWTPASTIIHGGAGSGVLDASANTSGSFTYSATPTGGGAPSNITSGTSALAVGSYNLTADFTPSNTAVYDSAQATATLLVSGESVWIVDGPGGLSELAGDGYGITSSADPGANLAVAIDSSGNVWTVGSGSALLEETSQAGASLNTISAGTGGLNAPEAIAIDGNGQIWIVNGDNSVSLFSNAGTALSPSTGFTGATLSTPSGVAVDLSGSVWITNKGTNSVTRILGAAAPAAPLSTAAANQTTGAKP